MLLFNVQLLSFSYPLLLVRLFNLTLQQETVHLNSVHQGSLNFIHFSKIFKTNQRTNCASPVQSISTPVYYIFLYALRMHCIYLADTFIQSNIQSQSEFIKLL